MTNFDVAREAMVDCQVRPSDVTKYPIIRALLNTPREEYVPESKRSVAYVGDHIALTSDRHILDPRTFAKMLDALNIRSNELVLDIACGTGYSTAITAQLAQAVVAVEDDPSLANKASEILAEQNVDNAIVVNALLNIGSEKHGPYDVIILQGAIEDFPSALRDQLKEGGRIAAILKDGVMGQCCIGIKRNGTIAWNPSFDATAPILDGFEKSKEFAF